MTPIPPGEVLWFLFQWLWLVWISIICPASIIFAVIAVVSAGDRSRRYRKLAIAFAAVAAALTFVFILLMLFL